jgi:uncharacterized protein
MAVRSDDLIFAFILLAVYPIADYIVMKHAKRSMQPRKWSFAWILASEWLFTIGVVILLLRQGLTFSALGQALGRPMISLAVVAAGLGLLAVANARNRERLAQASPAQLAKLLDRVGLLIPRSGVERVLFVLVGLSAGFCEELLYRGWLWHFFEDLTGHLWIAVLLAVIAFALAHSYQGRAGIVETGIVGLIFSGVVLLAGSLVPAQVIHVGMDLMNGFLLSRAAKSV